MNLLFATLLCHRDFEIFKFNWFASRINLDHGFDIPHLILNDGTLTSDELIELKQLPNVIVEEQPVKLYDVPKAVYFAKLEGFEIGFNKYRADRVVVIDADVFFYKNWDADLRKICSSKAIALRDWGSSLGPYKEEFIKTFGVWEDANTPNCNSGICSIPKEQYPKLLIAKSKYIDAKFMGMEDQGTFFAAFYGELSYVNNIKCFVMGGEYHPSLLNWMLSQNGSHLMGMHVRPDGMCILQNASKQSFKDLSLSQFTPIKKHISWGLLEYGTYDFTKTYQYYPSQYQGNFITDALYMHGGSWVEYQLPKQLKQFETQVIILDTGAPNTMPIIINNQAFKPGDSVSIPLDGHLLIKTFDAPGSHLAFLNPLLKCIN